MKATRTQAGRKLRQSMQAALATVVVSLAFCGGASAATLLPAAGSTGHAMLLFAIAWLFASLRIRKVEGRWRVGFELSPLKGLATSRTTLVSAQEGTQS